MKRYLIKESGSRREVGRLFAPNYIAAVKKMNKDGWLGCFVQAQNPLKEL